MAARDPLPAAALDETTTAAAMDQEPTQDNEDGTWFLVARKRKKQVQATSSLPPNTEPAQQDHLHLTLRNKSSQLPPLPIDDLKVIFRPRDGLNLEQQKMAEQQLQQDKKSSKVTTFNGAAPATTDATRGRPRYRSRGHSQSQSRSRSRVRMPSKDQKQPRGRSRSGSRSLTQQKQPPKEPQAAWAKTPDHLPRKATANRRFRRRMTRPVYESSGDTVGGSVSSQTRVTRSPDDLGAALP
ncbi:probable splicing factor, arginine/serine-rich 1 [Dermacentor albipictus]|uniref:probable splicing factor, arginine/serine-rich 1 n=1 Tax=Dermacentor albipictus TaxID=60249 RepID=UPI0038FD0545